MWLEMNEGNPNPDSEQEETIEVILFMLMDYVPLPLKLKKPMSKVDLDAVVKLEEADQGYLRQDVLEALFQSEGDMPLALAGLRRQMARSTYQTKSITSFEYAAMHDLKRTVSDSKDPQQSRLNRGIGHRFAKPTQRSKIMRRASLKMSRRASAFLPPSHSHNTILPLVEQLTSDVFSKRLVAIAALGSLASSGSNHQAILNAGVFPVLLELLESETGPIRVKIVSTFLSLSRDPKAREMLRAVTVLKSFIQILDRESNDDTRKFTAGILRSVTSVYSRDGERALIRIRKLGGVAVLRSSQNLPDQEDAAVVLQRIQQVSASKIGQWCYEILRREAEVNTEPEEAAQDP